MIASSSWTQKMQESDLAQNIERSHASPWFLFSIAASAGMFLLIAAVSCTSNETFSQVYTTVTDFLLLSKTTLSASLRESPNLGHFLCYALLSLSLSGVFSRRSRYLAPLAIVGFGILMEFVQFFIPSRNSSLLDIGINTLGIASGFGIYWLWVTYVQSSKKPN